MVTHGADANAPDVAELAFGILLASTRRIVRADKMIRRGEWTKRIPNRFGAIAGLTGGRLGILGLGAIGFGLLTTAVAVGGLAGTAAYGRLERRFALGDITSGITAHGAILLALRIQAGPDARGHRGARSEGRMQHRHTHC